MGHMGCSCAVAVAFATAVAIGGAPQPAVGAGASLCWVGSSGPEGGSVQCYPPGRLAIAERQMSTHPVRPTSAIRKATALHLTQLALRALRVHGSPIEIMYLFGRIPTTSRGLPDFSSHRSRYVLVS